jgi:predicted phosphoribosyltransferase
MIRFKDRVDAGKMLVPKLKDKVKDSIVLAIPRGGVIVGDIIASELNLMLDVICPRKLGAPGNPELAIGAIMHDGTYILNHDIIYMLRVDEEYIKEEMRRKKEESMRRLMLYRGNIIYDINNKNIILVDDGIATGSTIYVVVKWLKANNIKDLIIATPVGPVDTLRKLENISDVISILMPYDFNAVGEFYEHFEEVSDDQVRSILARYKSI